jgi:hypothetical protein
MKRGVVLLCLVLGAAAVQSASAGPLRTAIVDPDLFPRSSTQVAAFDRTRAAGASVVRLILNWNSVAPSARPAGFEPTNPADPAYNWGAFDRQVQLAAERGLEPIIAIFAAPRWAKGPDTRTGGDFRPKPSELRAFATAAAHRYSGAAGLPRVRHWQVWNEPNRDYFLMPQFVRGRMVSAGWYRSMVRAFAAGVHAINPTNVAVAGGLAPLGRPGKPAPLAFMRKMLCVSRTLRPTCNLRRSPIPFDVWSHHPYTSGGPTHRARGRDDVSLGDLPEMRRLLRAAIRLGHVRSRGRVGFWVTEFGWDTRPPDPQGLPMRLHARWVSEALYRMWRNGVGVVTWFRIQDDPLSRSYYQSGFYTASGRPKRSLTAFRFPVVALTRQGGVYVWGRTPLAQSGRVVLEIKAGRHWRRLGGVNANGNGIFARTYRTRARTGYVRARFGRETSVPFSLRYVRDRFANPFGCGGVISC